MFNGEILNYRELRSGLRYPFRTSPGIPRRYSQRSTEYGPSFVEHLSGQFAFAIHDGNDGSVWLYRDRLGILPLYYWLDDHQLVFASEIKALFPALPRRPEVDQQGLASYLAHRSVPAPGTLFAGVRKLKPGHLLHVTRDGLCALSSAGGPFPRRTRPEPPPATSRPPWYPEALRARRSSGISWRTFPWAPT